MLSFQDFFIACAGEWTTERTYHSVLRGEIERSYTEFRATSLDQAEKQQILADLPIGGAIAGIKLDLAAIAHQPEAAPGFAIAFDTRSETGEEVSMSLKALFLPDPFVQTASDAPSLPIPLAAQVKVLDDETIQGYYLRDKGYSESGAIAGRFTYQPTRQTLEMTTFYNRSVAVDQMRFVSPDLRMRTIVTYRRSADETVPTVIDLIGFGVERKR
jgi:hypothetical protein